MIPENCALSTLRKRENDSRLDECIVFPSNMFRFGGVCVLRGGPLTHHLQCTTHQSNNLPLSKVTICFQPNLMLCTNSELFVTAARGTRVSAALIAGSFCHCRWSSLSNSVMLVWTACKRPAARVDGNRSGSLASLSFARMTYGRSSTLATIQFRSVGNLAITCNYFHFQKKNVDKKRLCCTYVAIGVILTCGQLSI